MLINNVFFIAIMENITPSTLTNTHHELYLYVNNACALPREVFCPMGPVEGLYLLQLSHCMWNVSSLDQMVSATKSSFNAPDCFSKSSLAECTEKWFTVKCLVVFRLSCCWMFPYYIDHSQEHRNHLWPFVVCSLFAWFDTIDTALKYLCVGSCLNESQTRCCWPL